jgi:hypothetical protein
MALGGGAVSRKQVQGGEAARDGHPLLLVAGRAKNAEKFAVDLAAGRVSVAVEELRVVPERGGVFRRRLRRARQKRPGAPRIARFLHLTGTFQVRTGLESRYQPASD